VSLAPGRGRELGCDVIQIFVKSNNQWRAAPLRDAEVRAFREELAAHAIRCSFAHTSYLLNLASPDRGLRRKSLASFVVELERCERLGLAYLVLHPGSHVGDGEERGLARVAGALREALDRTGEARVAILVETTAGQGTNLGWRFEHLARLIDDVAGGDRVGVCLDTCHVFAAGYDLRTTEAYRATMRELDRVIGIRRVRAVHLNDSERDLGSRVDRHAHIGRGKIGREGFRLLLRDRRFRRIPMVLETPKGERGEMDRKNLALLRRLAAAEAAGRRSGARGEER
jgi:deoxyribonuclease-4